MIGNKRNFSLTIWNHEDNYICALKSANSDFEGQSYNENFSENVNGEKTLTFSVPMYIFKYKEFVDEEETILNRYDKNNFIQNEIWKHIYNEQKIRYIEYDIDTNKPKRIEEFVLKTHNESRNGEQKIADCTCESLAVYELGKVGWNINFDTDYVSKYELENNEDELLTLDYWLKKIFYKETNLGRVSTTTECSYLLQGKQLRNEDGAPISDQYIIDKDGNYIYNIIEEPIASTTDLAHYINLNGWTWSIQAKDVRNPASKELTNIIYETPVVNKYIEDYPNQYKAFSYQKIINQTDSQKTLRPHPIEERDYGSLVYVTDIKKRLFNIERSNIYNIIGELSSIFEIFPYFQYYYDDSGKIIGREILFKTEAINDDITFDFSYGKNLLSCQRSTDSNDLVTKLIVPDTESTINEGSILSIKQATANQTGEGYLYNFKYFYDNGMLSSGEYDINSDEYKINLHCGKLKDYNTNITNLQKYLTPLYDRQDKLNSDLLVQEASKTAIMDNMRSIQDKIDAIPIEQQVINSWSEFSTQYNHIGEIKTITTTNEENGEPVYYIDFGREDIVYNQVNVVNYTIDQNNKLVEGTTTSISTFIPRCYKTTTWNPSSTVIPENNTSNFILLNNSTYVKEVVYSTIRDKQPGFIKAIKLKDLPIEGQTFVRIRYKRAPLAWYYLLIKDYWDQLLEIEDKISKIDSQLQEINNKILVNELNLNKLLAQKNEEILQFEKKYKPFIREGYWEANSYQGQISPKQLYTGNTGSHYDKKVIKDTPLGNLNLNESIHNYTKYINLGVAATNIDIDSIDIKTKNPAYSAGGNTILPRYRGNDYEVYLNTMDQVIIAISPSLVDTYDKYNYDQQYYACDVKYKLSNGTQQGYNDVAWSTVQYNNPIIREKHIYITNDNIITDSIAVYGGSTTDNQLTLYDDYTYTFDYVGYDNEGHVVDLDNQTSYSTDIQYDYITKITLKNTNEVNKYSEFYITYNEDSTLQYLYQDAVQMSRKYAEPQITYTINVVDISSLYGYENYKPTIGQKVPIYDKEMGFNGFEGFITSVSKPLESSENTQITIATYTNKFEDVFQKLTATMTDIKYNESSIYNAADSFGDTGAIKSNVFQKSLADNTYQISLGVNNEVTIDKKSGITLLDIDNNSAVKLIGRGVFLTQDYQGDLDSTWKTGITGEGINANALITGNIDTKNINIWNATEGQIRFMWNEEGLTAYGATGVVGSSISLPQDFVDYNKYVRYNYDGLEFVDKTDNITRSALKLGWDGLDIRAQNDSLILNAEKGLTIQNSTTTRLHLGKFAENLYGLKLMNNSGNTVFQNDSEGNLWLQQYIKVGGEINDDGSYSTSPNAGIYGIETSDDKSEQMGPVRNENGNMNWASETLRFWAGPRSYTDLINSPNREEELINIAIQNIDGITTSLSTVAFPSLSKFRVSKSGEIVASGIDVGGWIGGGKFLRSRGNQAVLRSDGYSSILPVLAIGTTTNSITSGVNTGQNYNFRVFQDGSLNIGRGQFTATSTGAVTAKSINIVNGSAAGFNIAGDKISIVSGNNTTYISSSTKSGARAIVAGNTSTPQFIVYNNGKVEATDLHITGGSINIGGINTTAGTVNATVTGNVGGLTVNANSLVFTTTEVVSGTTYTYKVGLYSVRSGTATALEIGLIKEVKGSTHYNPTAPFKVQNNGKLIASNADITGEIKANSGKIGGTNGFTITTGKIYSGSKSTSTDTNSGLYLGTDGIALGNNKFKVSTSGYLTAASGTIGGLGIFETYIRMTKDVNVTVSTTTSLIPYQNTTQQYVIDIISSNSGTDNSVIRSGLVKSTNTNDTSLFTTQTPDFRVTGKGKLYAKEADIQGKISASSGSIGNWNISTDTNKNLYSGSGNNYVGLFPKSDNSSNSAVILIGNTSAATAAANTNTKFKVSSDGSVYFHGDIYGYNDSKGRFVKGLKLADVKLVTVNGDPISVEINNGLVIDIVNG